jgi:BirA family transcriptional regulator, biotin operon repressor / biotin---[acetyl-CoA-carboxylase] ligase
MFKNVTSTNDTAINLIKNKNKLSGCVFSDNQTKGRGTHSKSWVSNKGNLFMSIFFPLKKKYPPFNEFATINPIIISKVIKIFCNREVINLKWPNDILLNKKKICGILQEVITKNSKKFLIIGIGLNILSNPYIEKKQGATNLFSETNKKNSKKKVGKLIINSYESFFKNLTSYKYNKFKKEADLLVHK